MKPGDRVRVSKSVIVYHYPQQRKKPFDIKGMEGEVDKVMQDWRGRPISPNLPIVVKFEKKFKAHLREDELEIIN
ncbi:MAG: ferredoxin-thioredoxin reductase variable chain [Pleurocapsa sp.]